MIRHSSKKIWIDLDNSPHVPFFQPIIKEFNGREFSLMITARDSYQVCKLADFYKIPYKQIGRHYGKKKFFKVAGLLIRVLQLLPIVLRNRPDLALSHGSRSQVLLAQLLRIPSAVIMDYEHGKQVPFFHAKWLITPEIVEHENIKSRRVLKYPGIKEDVYVPTFEPDASILQDLGINGKDIVITIRPPATEAHYHSSESEDLFSEVINYVCDTTNTRIVVLPRNERQDEHIKKLWPGKCASGKIIIPKNVVHGLNMLWNSDLVISGGGTIIREAAALGVPAYSIFRGKLGAVDRYLASCGRLTLLKSVEDVRSKIVLTRWNRPVKPGQKNRPALHRIVEEIITILEST